MTDLHASAPPPVPVRRRDVAARYLRLGEIADEVRSGTYRIPAGLVAAALRDEADGCSQAGDGRHGAP